MSARLAAAIAAGGLALALSACGGSHSTPPAAAAPAASSPASILDRAPACTNALESEVDQAARAGKTGTFPIAVPPSCKGLSHAQVQALTDEIAGNYAQAQAFANAFRQAMTQEQGTGAEAS